MRRKYFVIGAAEDEWIASAIRPGTALLLTRVSKAETLDGSTVDDIKDLPMTIAIEHQHERQRFVAEIEGQECVIDYRLAGNTMTITHTGVPASLGGRGIAGKLARFALDEAKAQGWKVVPACSYVAAWIEKHPEYQGLLS